MNALVDALIRRFHGIDLVPLGSSPARRHRVGRRAGHRLPWRLLAIVGVVIALSVLLIPRGIELAVLRRGGGQVQGHGSPADHVLQLLEARLAAGERSPALIGALARERARQGNHDGSIQLLSTWLADRPDDTEALQVLSEQYRAAQRIGDYRDTLMELQRRQPSAIRQRELTRLALEKGTPAQHAEAQAELVDRFDAGEVADYLSLAKARFDRREPAAALATLDRLALRFPQAVDASVVQAQMNGVLAGNDAADAAARGHRWLQAHPGDVLRVAPRLAGTFSAAGHPAQAAQFLDAYLSASSPQPPLLAAWAQAMADAGRPAEALRRLQSVDARADGSGELQRLKQSLANPLDRADQAVLTAQIALQAGNRAQALRWTDAARAAPGASPLRGLQVARLYEQLGQPDKALEALRRVARLDADRASDGEVARLFVALGRADEGLAWIERLRSPPESAWRGSWALLATAAGRHDDVSRWLNAAGRAPSSAVFYRDLLYLAMDHKAPALAVAAGERLVRVSADDRDVLALGHALLAAGRGTEALAHLRPLRQRGGLDPAAYRALLAAAWRRGAPVADELRRETLDHLAGSRDTQDADIATLQALGAYAELMPSLERLAAADPPRWLGAYTEAAERTGQRSALIPLWQRLGEAESTPAALRSQVGFRLLEAGDKAAGERVFRLLAAQARPDDPATRQLLFLWGPRPGPAQLDWLEARARSATGDAKARWLRLLTERGAASRVIELAGKTAPRDADASVADAYLDALAARGDKAALRTALVDQARSTRSIPVLERLVHHAAALGEPATERLVTEAALAAGSTDPQLRRSLGLQAHRAHDEASAERWLNAYHAVAGGDPESQRVVGEIRLQRHDTQAAQQSFESALNLLDRSGETGHVARSTRAGLLHRLGRTAEARQQYEALLAERPSDDNLRADYVAMLLALGDAGQARTMLAETR